MFSSLSSRDGFGTGLTVVHFLRNILAGPGSFDSWIEVGYVLRAFAEVRGGEDYVVVVEVEAERDVEFFTYREEVVDGPGDVVVFED